MPLKFRGQDISLTVRQAECVTQGPQDTVRYEAARAVVKAIDEKAGTVRAIVSTRQTDRYGDIIIPEAFRKWMAAYMANPVFLWMHDRRGLPIGRAIAWEITEEGLWVTFLFDRGSEFGAEVFRLYAKGFLNAFSVSGLIHDWVFAWDSKEAKARVPDWAREAMEAGEAESVILELELIEVSAVTTPANRGALVRALELADKVSPIPSKEQAMKKDSEWAGNLKAATEALKSLQDELEKALTPDAVAACLACCEACCEACRACCNACMDACMECCETCLDSGPAGAEESAEPEVRLTETELRKLIKEALAGE